MQKRKETGASGSLPNAWGPIRFCLLISICAAFVACVGLVALLGWILELPVLASLGLGKIPVAPSTAVLLVLYAGVIFLRTYLAKSRVSYWTGLFISAAGALVAAVLFVLSLLGIRTAAEHLGFDVVNNQGELQVGRMSPVTAFCFLLSSFSYLMSLSTSRERRRAANIAWWLACCIIATGAALVMAYLYGTPLLYGSAFIPPAALTSMAFMALGTALLALATPHAWPSRTNVESTTRASYAFLLVFVLLAAGIVASGFLYYRNYEIRHRTEVEHEITAIADLKIDELVYWRKERLGDAALFYKNLNFSRLVKRYLKKSEDEETAQRLRIWLQHIREGYRYDRVLLLDPDGKEWMSALEGQRSISRHTTLRASEVLHTKQVTFEDFYRDEDDGRIYLAVLAPILDEQDKGRAVGTLVMRIDPEQYLYPFLNRWPTPSKTAETLLVRREGNEAVFLNELRFQKNTALKLRRSLDQKELPAAQAVLGRQGITAGRDYRGVPVIADLRAVPGSPWFLVSRMDVSEVYSPAREKLWMTVVLVMALVIGAGGGVGLVWRRQRIQFYREKYEAAEALSESQDKYRHIVANLGREYLFYRHDTNGVFNYVSPSISDMLGYSQQDALSHYAEFLSGNPINKEVVRHTALSIQGLQQPSYEVEIVHKDGSLRWLEITEYPVRNQDGCVVAVEGIARDITEYKNADKSRQASLRFLEAVHRNTEIKPLLEELAAEIKDYTGCDSVAVRVLDEAGNIPYQAHNGFSTKFVELEGPLSVKSDQCMCIHVIMGTTNPRLPFYTKGGSFYTNGTTRFLATVSEEEKGKTRNMCNREGYESVALVPFRSGGRILGLIHVADHRENMVPLKMVEQLESAAMQLGTAFQRANAEDALRKSETKYRMLHESMRDAFVSVNMQGRITGFNMMYTELLGYSPEELRSRTHADITPEKWHAFEQKIVEEQIIPRGYSDVYEKEYRRKDGTIFPVELRTFLIKDAAGNPAAMWAIVRDITERKKTEELLRGILESVDEGFIVIDRDYRIITANRAFNEKAGMLLEHIVGEHCYEISHQCDTPCYEAGEMCSVKQVFETGKPYTAVHTHHDAQGMPIHIETKAYPLSRDESGKVMTTIEILVDISGRKNAEEALRASEREYRQLVDYALMGVYKTTLEGKFLYVNDAMARIFECENADEMLRLPVGIRYKRPEDREAFLNILKERGKVPYYEIEVPTKTGQLKTIVISAVLDDGFITGMVTDITERKKTEDELGLFKNLINQVNDAIFVLDPVTGLFLDMNAKACNNLGYDREELLKMNIFDIQPDIPDGSSWKAHVNEVKNKAYVVLEGRNNRKDGTTFPVEVNVNYISLEKRDYMVAVIRDITERKKAGEALQKSEKKYKDLFDSTLDGIYQIDADGVFILMNPAGAKMFGYESPDEIIGRKDLEYWRDSKDRDAFRAELKIKKSVSGYYMRFKKKNGEPIELETSSTIKEDEKGAFLGMEGILRDITEHKKLEDQLRHAQKMEAVGALAGGIAHDFNNILNVIMGYGSMVLDKLKTDNPEKGQMNEILAAAERAAILTKRLLVFSRKQVVEVKPINVNETIMDIQKMLGRIIGEDIDFNLDLDDRNLAVMADAGQIEHVLINLAANAKDAMPNGGRLTIGTGLQEVDDEYIAINGCGRPGMYALITVSDTGSGMDAETQKKIFEPFFTTKGIGEGTGLGLAISYEIIKQHSGYIKVYSEPGQGTLFKIYLPLLEEPTSMGKKTEAAVPVRGGNETVLLAEDDASLRKLSRIVLESFGYSVITAEDGEDAIAKFVENEEKIDLAMLDMIMPKKNGKEVSEALRKASPRVKILFVSGYTMDIIKDKELTESGFDFIHKPIRPQDLLRKVREVLDK